MDKQRFLDRYIQFWQDTHPNLSISNNLKETALRYCQKLTCHNITYEKFDEICSALEESPETISINLNFNLVAYVLDYVKSEYQEKMEQQGLERYIPLPQKRTPLGQIDLKKLESSLKILKRNCPNLDMLGMLERINTLRSQGYGKEDRYCQSCDNIGYVYVNNNLVACCQCAKGERVYNLQGDIEKVRMATYEECQKATQGYKGQQAMNGAPL